MSRHFYKGSGIFWLKLTFLFCVVVANRMYEDMDSKQEYLHFARMKLLSAEYYKKNTWGCWLVPQTEHWIRIYEHNDGRVANECYWIYLSFGRQSTAATFFKLNFVNCSPNVLIYLYIVIFSVFLFRELELVERNSLRIQVLIWTY